MTVKMAFVLALSVGFLMPQAAYSERTKSQEPIKIIINDWTSQIVLANILGVFYERLGYRVAYSKSTSNEQWGALSRGVSHVQVEVWEGTMSDMFNRMLETGNVVHVGDHNAATREEWWYPSYVEDVCPGLPDWKALRDCASLFANETSAPMGIYVAGPWEKPEAARVRALGMSFRIKKVTDSDDLWEALAKASANKTPIVLFNWTPNWVEDRYEGKFVEFPEYDPACETDPSWGVNKEYPYDCGNPKDGWLKKAAWKGVEKQWPCAYQVLQNFNFTNKMIASVAARVDVDKLSYQDVANEWIQKNESLWKNWIPAECEMEK